MHGFAPAVQKKFSQPCNVPKIERYPQPNALLTFFLRVD